MTQAGNVTVNAGTLTLTGATISGDLAGVGGLGGLGGQGAAGNGGAGAYSRGVRANWTVGGPEGAAQGVRKENNNDEPATTNDERPKPRP